MQDSTYSDTGTSSGRITGSTRRIPRHTQLAAGWNDSDLIKETCGSTSSESTYGDSTDSGSTDSSSTDNNFINSGFTDSSSTKSFLTDSNSIDNGFTDSGSTDSGFTDSNSTDSGSTDDEATDTYQPKKRKYSGSQGDKRKKRFKWSMNYTLVKDDAKYIPLSLLKEKEIAIRRHGGYISTDHKWAFGDFSYRVGAQNWKEGMVKYVQYSSDDMQGVWLKKSQRHFNSRTAWYWGLDSMEGFERLIENIEPTVSQAVEDRNTALRRARETISLSFVDDKVFPLMKYVTTEMLDLESTIPDSMLPPKYMSEHLKAEGVVVRIELELLIQVAKLIRAYPLNFRGFCPVKYRLGLEFAEDWNRGYYAFKYWKSWSKILKSSLELPKKDPESKTPVEPVQWVPIPVPCDHDIPRQSVEALIADRTYNYSVKNVERSNVEAQEAENVRRLSSTHLDYLNTETQYSEANPFLPGTTHLYSLPSPHLQNRFPISSSHQVQPSQRSKRQQEDRPKSATIMNQSENQSYQEKKVSHGPGRNIAVASMESDFRKSNDDCVLEWTRMIESLEEYIKRDMVTLDAIATLVERAAKKLERLVDIQKESHNPTCMVLFPVILSQMVKFLEIGCTDFFTGIEPGQDLQPGPKLRQTFGFGGHLDDVYEQLAQEARLVYRAIMHVIEVFQKVKALATAGESDSANRQGIPVGIRGFFIDLEARMKKLGIQMGKGGHISNVEECVNSRF